MTIFLWQITEPVRKWERERQKNNSAAKTMHISNILSSSMQENETRQKAISWWCYDKSETDGDKINMDERERKIVGW